MIDGRLKGKKVLVTGWKSGIGKAIMEKIFFEAGEVFRFQGDVSKREDWNNALNLCQNSPTWAVINCAGIAEAKGIFDIDEISFKNMLDVNTLSVFHSIQTFGKNMIDDAALHDENNPNCKSIIGHIVSITSISGLTGFSSHAHYCASKFATNGLMQVAAKELSKYSILCNCVCPGPTQTPMWEKLDREYSALNGVEPGEMNYMSKQLIKRIGKPEDTANMVAWLISDENTYITGCNIKVCGGNLIG